MAIRIISEEAALSDSSAMSEFLSPIPNGDQLAKVLEDGKAVSTRAYDDETETARFVVSDGKTALCFTVTNITIDQAEMIAAECLDIQWSDKAFREAVERALGAITQR